MNRKLLFAIAALAAFAGRADAIEMFTNFNNGQNVGLPPMEVPISVYRGFGHGGWNPYAEGMPLKTNPPVPAMMPTGQVPHTWQQPQYNGMPMGNQPQLGRIPSNSSPRLAGDRRRARWQRGSYRPQLEPSGTNDSSAAQKADLPNPTGPEVEDEPRTVTAPAAGRYSPGNGQISPAIVLHPQPGIAPDALPSDDAADSSPSTSAKGTSDFAPQADALFPHGDAL